MTEPVPSQKKRTSRAHFIIINIIKTSKWSRMEANMLFNRIYPNHCELHQHLTGNNSKTTINPLSTNPTKWSNPLKQSPTNCLKAHDHFVGLKLKCFILTTEKNVLLKINLFLANIRILYPLKPENQRFFCLFRGYILGTLATNGL